MRNETDVGYAPATLISSTLAFFAILPFLRPACAQTDLSISFGENLEESVSCGSTDTYTFSANANDVVVAHVVELSDFGGVCAGYACLCFDQLVEIRDASNRVLADNSSPSSRNSGGKYRTQVGPTRLPATGSYTLSIRDKQNNGHGEYRVFLQAVNAPVGAELLQSGESRLDVLNLGEVTTYSFDAHRGDRVAIEMLAADVGNLVPQLALYSPDGLAVALPIAGTIDRVLNQDGQFTLLAFSATDESGSYLLTVAISDCRDTGSCADRQCTNDGDCLDGNECTLDRCTYDECSNPLKSCNDDNPCTTDTCDTTTGCVFAPDDTKVCDDGVFCNGNEQCHAGACVPGPLPCDPNTEVCDDVNDRCVALPSAPTTDDNAGSTIPTAPNTDDTGAVSTDATSGTCTALCGVGCGLTPAAPTVGLIILALAFLRFIGPRRGPGGL